MSGRSDGRVGFHGAYPVMNPQEPIAMAGISKPLKVDVLEVIHGLTVEVRAKNVCRLKLGLWFVAIGARILRSPVNVVEGQPD